MNIKIGLTDDHQLFLKSLALLISTMRGFEVIVEALNGKDLLEKLDLAKELPDIILLDVNMPVLDGRQTAEQVQQRYPAIRLAALSMNDTDKTIIAMIKAGCCAFLLKDTHPTELEKGLHEIYFKGYYNADACNINYRRLLLAEKEMHPDMTEREKQFLQLACSDLTYKQIADTMHLSERTIDGYRENLFRKFNVQSRVGLCLEAVRREIVTP